jgi:hypothetical protein
MAMAAQGINREIAIQLLHFAAEGPAQGCRRQRPPLREATRPDPHAGNLKLPVLSEPGIDRVPHRGYHDLL